MTTTIHDFQERLDTIPKERTKLSDGLAVHNFLKEIDEKVESLSEQALKTKQEQKDIAFLKQLKIKALAYKDRWYTCAHRWLEAGYQSSFIESDPDGVIFFGESDFRSIQQFKDPKSQLTKVDMDLRFQNGKILFKVENQWQLYSEIKEQIKYDPINHKFIGWTYVHPDGFVQVDSTEWTTLRPYGQLSQEAHEELKTVASQCGPSPIEPTAPKIDPSKPCVLQVMVIHEDLPPHPFFKNADKMAARHCQVRLVDEKGQVYCFGLWADKENLEAIFPNNSFTLQTGTFRLSIPDSFENKAFSSDTISIPLSLEKFQEIKTKAEQINQTGIFYCLTNRNCCRLAQKILKLADIEIDTRISLFQLLLGYLPDAIDIPYIGRPLSRLSSIVSSVYSKMHFCLSLAPTPIKEGCLFTKKIVCFVPKKIFTALCALILLALGGSRGSSLLSVTGRSASQPPKKKRLIHSLWDLFNEKTLRIHHPSILRAWMQKQGSYQFFEHHGFCVVKP